VPSSDVSTSEGQQAGGLDPHASLHRSVNAGGQQGEGEGACVCVWGEGVGWGGDTHTHTHTHTHAHTRIRFVCGL
jgi:hypothetical protein